VNFFASQELARRQSRWLLLLYAVSLAGVVLAIDAAVLLAHRTVRINPLAGPSEYPSLAAWARLHPDLFWGTTLAVVAFVGVASLYRMLRLRAGGSVVAEALGGEPVSRDSADPARRRLLNIVEEMAIASGMPVPAVYVIEVEATINAFSAGHVPADAAIAVTRGALERLDRDQLQAVVGHEFSHILNGDMRLSIRLMSLAFGLLALVLLARSILSLSRRSDRAIVPAMLLFVVVMAVGYVGLAGARVLQALISRRREALADASSVQFTRNPGAITGALVRAAAQGRVSGFAGAAAEDEVVAGHRAGSSCGSTSL
jgi:Zn-dependent protease with chaperone function